MDNWNPSFGIDSDGNTIYAEMLANEENDSARQQYVAHLVKQLLKDANGNTEWALHLGKTKMRELQETEERLYQACEIDCNASDKQMDAYYSAVDNLYYMKGAITALEKEVSGTRQTGFHFSPDNTYPPHYQYTDKGLERIDPLTGYAYYPYAS